MPSTCSLSEMTVIGERLVARFPEANAGTAVQTEALQEPVVAGARPALLILLGAVSLVMLIACVNVAGLVAVRVARYRQEARYKQRSVRADGDSPRRRS